ncbi:MAG: hypothetical protein JF614_09385 [Acidobacteria bacterium]|nr:hypothetical protein [Acidobacteriota bacterium]
MLHRLLSFALASLLLPAAVLAQEPAQPQEPRPAEQPAKKPDAFKYFFGKKDEKDSKDTKDTKDSRDKKDAGAKTEAAPAQAPASVKSPEPAPAAAPAPASEPQPAPAKPAPRVDAFQYFFGKSSQPRPEAKKEEPGEKKPLDAFDYLFGKKSKESAAEPAKESARPPGS